MIRHPRITQWLVIMLAAVMTAAPVLYAADQQQLVIYHWWTAGGERQAMQVIFDAFTKKNPSTKIVDNPVAGGGGITLKTVLLGMLAAKIPPDTDRKSTRLNSSHRCIAYGVFC